MGALPVCKSAWAGAWGSLFKHEGALGTAGKKGAKQGGRVVS
jgi:hypothetical protein